MVKDKALDHLLRVQNLTSFYGLIQALFDVSIEVNSGEIVAVIGANGAGKTTLLRAISGIVPSTQGVIQFMSKRIDQMAPEQIVRLGLSHVPERRELFDSLSVLENLHLGAYHRRGKANRIEIQRDLENIWEIFPILNARKKQDAGTLSGGEQQMLAIARGLMARPKLLMLDEPSLGLAPLLVKEVLRIVSMLRDIGQTVLLVEQNASGALEIADRAYLMEVGRIILQGSSLTLLHDERVRRAYLGKRVAPANRPQKLKPVSIGSNFNKRKSASMVTNRNRDVVKDGLGMDILSETLASFTLPDEFFERRLSYSDGEIKTLQDKKLAKVYKTAFDNSPFYHSKFTNMGFSSETVGGLEDLSRIPLTRSEEITPSSKQVFNTRQLMMVDTEDVSLVHTSSGTTGAPKIFPYTGRDISLWAANTATVFWINGFRKKDIVLSVMPFGEFTGGGGLYFGMTALGATYLPIAISPGVTDKVMAHLLGKVTINDHEIMIDPLLRANSIVCLGSFLPRLEEMLDEYDVQPGELSLSKISSGAEPSSDAVRTRIAERFGIWPRDNYGLGEFYGPGVAGECEVGGGLHILSDTYIAEVLDPETGEPVEEGEMGELVLTSLCKEAMPLFRYCTGDRVMALPKSCPCGIAHKWIGRVPGRIDMDDIMIPGGVIINRTYLENTLLNIDGAGTEYILTVSDHPNRKGLTRLFICVEGESAPELVEVISHRIQVEYNHNPIVTVLPKGTLPRKSGKAKRILTPDEYWKILGKDFNRTA